MRQQPSPAFILTDGERRIGIGIVMPISDRFRREYFELFR
jgi:hypothetical protein